MKGIELEFHGSYAKFDKWKHNDPILRNVLYSSIITA